MVSSIVSVLSPWRSQGVAAAKRKGVSTPQASFFVLIMGTHKVVATILETSEPYHEMASPADVYSVSSSITYMYMRSSDTQHAVDCSEPARLLGPFPPTSSRRPSHTQKSIPNLTMKFTFAASFGLPQIKIRFFIPVSQDLPRSARAHAPHIPICICAMYSLHLIGAPEVSSQDYLGNDSQSPHLPIQQYIVQRLPSPD